MIKIWGGPAISKAAQTQLLRGEGLGPQVPSPSFAILPCKTVGLLGRQGLVIFHQGSPHLEHPSVVFISTWTSINMT